VPEEINRFFSAIVQHDDGLDEKHCLTCQCSHNTNTVTQEEIKEELLPPPLPPPNYSVHKRVLPSSLVALSSKEGRQRLVDHLSTDDADSYYLLTQHSMNQSDPAYCGPTTLVVVLNALSIDPHVRWRGGWRYFGDESVLLGRCCLNPERIRRVGITMEEFHQLATCQGVEATMTRAHARSVQELRNTVKETLLIGKDSSSTTSKRTSIIVASYSRVALGQTGDGHYSPVAAYHAATDSVLILDVARFKYPPYWVSLEQLYEAMIPVDGKLQQSRGWFVLTTSSSSCSEEEAENRRPAKLVPLAGEPDICPLGTVKVQYCKASHTRLKTSVDS